MNGKLTDPWELLTPPEWLASNPAILLPLLGGLVMLGLLIYMVVLLCRLGPPDYGSWTEKDWEEKRRRDEEAAILAAVVVCCL